MSAIAKQEDTLSTLLVTRWEEIGQKVAKLANEFPEEKFEFRPVAGVRTFGEVLRHLAFWNQYVAARLRGNEFDDSLNELPLTDCPTKARAMEALARSSREAVTALKNHPSALDPKSVEFVMSFVEHTCEHYGQLVAYHRLIPAIPATSHA